jgi:hypothetical protein
MTYFYICIGLIFYRCTASRYGLDKVAAKLKEHDISGLLIIGGFEVHNSSIFLSN